MMCKLTWHDPKMLPSIPCCLCPRFLSLHLRLPHPFSFIRLPLSFLYILTPSFSQFRIFPSFSMRISPSLHIAMFPVECLCVCCCAGCGGLCTQWFVCSGSQSLHTAASSIIKCNGTFTFTTEHCSAGRFPGCSLKQKQ